MSKFTIRDLVSFNNCVRDLPPATSTGEWSRNFLLANGLFIVRVEKRLATRGFAAAVVICKTVRWRQSQEHRQIATATGTAEEVRSALIKALMDEFAKGSEQ